MNPRSKRFFGSIRWSTWPLLVVLGMLVFSRCNSENRRMTAVQVDDISPSQFRELRTVPPPTGCKELKGWLTSHRSFLTGTVIRSSRRWEVQYRPALLSACRNYPEGKFSDTDLRREVEESVLSTTYALHLTNDKQNDRDDEVFWNEELGKDIVEVLGGDTLPCAFIHLEPGPGFLKYRTAMIGFDHGQLPVKRQIIINDPLDRFGGAISFLIDATVLSPLEPVLDTIKPKGS